MNLQKRKPGKSQDRSRPLINLVLLIAVPVSHTSRVSLHCGRSGTSVSPVLVDQPRGVSRGELSVSVPPWPLFPPGRRSAFSFCPGPRSAFGLCFLGLWPGFSSCPGAGEGSLQVCTGAQTSPKLEAPMATRLWLVGGCITASLRLRQG